MSLCVLNVLAAVFEDMGDRDSVGDPFLQLQVTRPPSHAIKRDKDIVKVNKKRLKGCPAAAKRLCSVFKGGETVKGRVAEDMLKGNTETADKIGSRLFSEAESTPGGLSRFKALVEKDIERFAYELKLFKETKERDFD